MYLCFLKFGFGRCSADVSIAIRDGWMNRGEAVDWVKHYDGEYPWKYHDQYLRYFNMGDDEFWGVLESHANRNIVRKSHSRDKPWALRKPIDAPSLATMEGAYGI